MNFSLSLCCFLFTHFRIKQEITFEWFFFRIKKSELEVFLFRFYLVEIISIMQMVKTLNANPHRFAIECTNMLQFRFIHEGSLLKFRPGSKTVLIMPRTLNEKVDPSSELLFD